MNLVPIDSEEPQTANHPSREQILMKILLELQNIHLHLEEIVRNTKK